MNTSNVDPEVVEQLPASELIRKDSIEELVGHRNRALELARQALEVLYESELAAKRAAPQETYAGFIDALVRDRLYGFRTEGNYERPMKLVQKEVDRHAWASLQRLSGLRNLMDATAHEQMSKQLAEDPPPFTTDNVVATFASLAAQAPQLFERSLIAVFERLNTKDYKTNSAFRIGPRVVLTYVFSDYGYAYHGGKRELVGDLDRIFHTLDGKKPPEAGNAADAIEMAYRAKQTTCVTDYFDVRMFRGNGNMHVKFRRLDLLNRANDIIARHYGETLADNTKRG